MTRTEPVDRQTEQAGRSGKFAVIDMGSNSVRLMIAEVVSGRLGQVEKHLEMTRLGAQVDATKQLTEASMNGTIAALKTFKQMAADAGAELLGAFATSAVRDAANGRAFAQTAYEETGVRVEIIPGEAEAELGYQGVMCGVSESLGDSDFLIIDIGGGSTELIVGDRKAIKYRRSFNVGVVRMTGKHISTDPVSASEAAAMLEDIRDILKEGVDAVKALNPRAAIGIGGTATTFGAMKLQMRTYDRERIHNAQVTLEELEQMEAQLRELTVAKKRQLPGLMPKRADVIYAGSAILAHILRALNIESFWVSDYDNLEGILVEKNILK